MKSAALPAALLAALIKRPAPQLRLPRRPALNARSPKEGMIT